MEYWPVVDKMVATRTCCSVWAVYTHRHIARLGFDDNFAILEQCLTMEKENTLRVLTKDQYTQSVVKIVRDVPVFFIAQPRTHIFTSRFVYWIQTKGLILNVLKQGRELLYLAKPCSMLTDDETIIRGNKSRSCHLRLRQVGWPFGCGTCTAQNANVHRFTLNLHV